jgi:hypothetical protein
LIVHNILVVSIIVFLQGIIYIFSFHVHVYIQSSGLQMNTSVILNMVTEPQIRVMICFSLPNLPGHIALA